MRYGCSGKAVVPFTITAIVALGPGNWGEHRHLFPGQHRTAEGTAIPESRSDCHFANQKRPQGSFGGASPAKFAHWAQQTEVVEDVAAFGRRRSELDGRSVSAAARSERVSSAYFRLFGVPLITGRAFNAQEDTPGASPVAVISEGLWKSRFGSDPEDCRQNDDFGRRAVRHHGRGGRAIRFPGFRAGASSVGAIPTRPEHAGSGPLLPGGGTIEERRNSATG